MTEQEVEQLLRLSSNVWPTLRVTDDLVSAWHFVLADEPATDVLTATRYLAKTRKGDFCPKPQDIIAAMRELRNPLTLAEEVYSRGPKGAKTELEREAWKRWGGQRRMGSLPDPLYCDDPIAAERTLAFARKEFLETLNSLQEVQVKQPEHLTHSDSVKALDMLQARGVDLTSIGIGDAPRRPGGPLRALPPLPVKTKSGGKE